MLNNNDRRHFPGIDRDDPRNLLSHEARIRLDDAVFLQQSIRDSALANIVARCGDHWDDWDGAAKAQWSDAKVRAGVAGLAPLCRELMAIGKQGSELWDMMREELDCYANAWELSGLEKKAVFSQLWLVRVEEGRPEETQQQRSERRRLDIIPRLKSKGWTVYRWEKEAGVTDKVGRRYLNGRTTPRVEQRAKLAAALGMSQLPD